MDLDACVKQYHAQCMQSDWMIGGCARRHNVSILRELGCSTCDPKRIDRKGVMFKLNRDQCFFMQNAKEFAHDLPFGPHSPAVVHGLPNELMAPFVRRHLLHERANGSAPDIGHRIPGSGAGGGTPSRQRPPGRLGGAGRRFGGGKMRGGGLDVQVESIR